MRGEDALQIVLGAKSLAPLKQEPALPANGWKRLRLGSWLGSQHAKFYRASAQCDTEAKLVQYWNSGPGARPLSPRFVSSYCAIIAASCIAMSVAGEGVRQRAKSRCNFRQRALD